MSADVLKSIQRHVLNVSTSSDYDVKSSCCRFIRIEIALLLPPAWRPVILGREPSSCLAVIQYLSSQLTGLNRHRGNTQVNNCNVECNGANAGSAGVATCGTVAAVSLKATRADVV